MQAKAFDKKTSVLHYLAKIVRENDKSLVGFKEDIPSVKPAEGVILDGLVNDIKNLSEELSAVHETAKGEADRLEQSGAIRNMSLSELAEQRTLVRKIDGQEHYNKVDHLSGRTTMERFTLQAQELVKDAVRSIDNLKSSYVKLLEYFGEDEAMASDEFFGTINKFIVSFETAENQVDEAEKKKVSERIIILILKEG